MEVPKALSTFLHARRSLVADAPKLWRRSGRGGSSPSSRRTGQSLFELLVAIGVGAIVVVAITTLILPVLQGSTRGTRAQTAAALGKELMDNVRAWSGAGWHNIYDLNKGSSNHYYLKTSSSPFTAVSGDETLVIASGTYTRYFYVDNASRDANGLIVASGGTDDPSTQKVTVTYNWPGGGSSLLISYFTRSNDRVFMQTDWSGGAGLEGPVTITNNRFATSSNIDFATTTGSIMLNLQAP